MSSFRLAPAIAMLRIRISRCSQRLFMGVIKKDREEKDENTKRERERGSSRRE